MAMELSPKEVRMAVILSKMQSNNLAVNLKEYHRLLDALFFLHETLSRAKIGVPYWMEPSDTLMSKFYLHSHSFYNLLQGFEVRSEYFKSDLDGKRIIDFASAKVLLRSQMEAFLMYHHIYVNPKSESEKELRYNAWLYTSIIQRGGNVTAEGNFAKAQKVKDNLTISELKKRIQQLPAFKNLSNKQQNSLLEKGNGKLFKNWDTIIKESGFSEKHSLFQYYWLLSAYAHSEGVSILQIKQSNRDSINDSAIADLFVSIQIVCCMILSIKKLFKAIEIQYNGLPQELQDTIEIYAEMSRREAMHF